MKTHFAKLHFTILCLLLAVMGVSWSFGQYKVSSQDPNVLESPILRIEKVATIDPGKIADDWYPSARNISVVHTPGVNVEKDRYLAAKEEANRKYAEILANSGAGAANKASGTTADAPSLGIVFYGNPYDGGIPNDNGIAISNGGKIVSVTNSTIRGYDESGGAAEFAASLQGFSGGFNGTTSKYDPKATYDPSRDRFIVVFLSGFTHTTSDILVFFSTTNDPSDPWNMYSLDGNVGTSNVWTDFPQIGISNDELFITGNLFTNSGVGQGSVVWQIGLNEGFAGSTLTTKNYVTSYFSLHPVEGALTMYGPNHYLIRNVSNPFGSTSTYYIHQITNTIGAGGTLNSPITFNSSTSYSLSPDANQKGTSIKLNTNDCRVQSSYLENNRIQFGHNTAASGKPGIYYGTIELSDLDLSFSSVSGVRYYNDSLEVGYPGVAYGGCTDSGGDNTSVVMFNYTGSSYNPGNACVYFENKNVASAPTICKAGFTYMGSSSPWRWGDYADAAERHNNPGEIWIGGSVGLNSSGHQNATYISQVFSACDPVAVDNKGKDFEGDLTAYPNPAVDYIHFDFDVPSTGIYKVSVMDMKGQIVKVLVEDKLKEGTARAAFSTQHLGSGVYFVVVESGNQAIYKEKFVVNK